MTDYYGYPYVALTGGGDGALDSLDGSLLKNGDFAVVVLPTSNTTYIYTLDEDSGAAESSPDVIAPDANAGDKRWVLTTYGTALTPGSDAANLNYLQAGTGMVTRTVESRLQEKLSVLDAMTSAQKTDVLGYTGAVDVTAAVQAVIDYAESVGGRCIVWPSGKYRIEGQLTIEASGIDWLGSGTSSGTAARGTVLDLRYGGHKIIIGDGTNRVDAVRFSNMHLWGYNGGNYYLFETRYARDIRWDNLTFGGAYGFAKLGRSGETTQYATFSNIIGNMLSTGHQHFLHCINVPGGLSLTGVGSVEGNSSTGTSAIQFETSSERPDGVNVGPGWGFGLFDRGVNLLAGGANIKLIGAQLDRMLLYGVYADTTNGSINDLSIVGCHVAINDPAVESYGILIAQSTESAVAVKIQDCKVFQAGREGIWVTGTMAAQVTGNFVYNAGQETDDTYSSFRYGTGVLGLADGNVSFSDAANSPKYGHKIETAETSPSFEKGVNASIGHGTAAEG